MALTRKFLSGMGLSAEQVDAIIDEHSETVDSLKEQRDDYKEKAENLKNVQSELDDLKKQVKDGMGDAAEWKEKYENEHKELEDLKKAEERKALIQAKSDVYTKLLKENNVGEKQIPSILGVTNFEEMKLDKDGNLENVEELTKIIQEKWGGFITTTGTKGADVETPPKGSGTKYESKADIMKIKDTTERRKAIAENAELFNN